MPLRDIGGMVFGRDFPARYGGGRLFSDEEFDLTSPTFAPLSPKHRPWSPRSFQRHSGSETRYLRVKNE